LSPRSAIGSAVWHLQFLEDVLVTYVTMRLKIERPLSMEKAREILAEQRKKTLGALLKDARQANIVEGEMKEAFGVLLEERNWLVHSSMHESTDTLYTEQGKNALITRLRILEDRAIELKKKLAEDVFAWSATQGVDVAQVKELSVDQIRKLRGE
jgi:hypothetical protein